MDGASMDENSQTRFRIFFNECDRNPIALYSAEGGFTFK